MLRGVAGNPGRKDKFATWLSKQGSFITNMLSKEVIVETGDQPYRLPPRWRRVSDELDEMTVTLPDGRNLSLFFEHENRMALFTFLVDDNNQITGGGDAYRIFSTAYQAIEDWVRKNKPLYFAFTAAIDENPDKKIPSRPKLYDRIVTRLITTVPGLKNWVNITNRWDLWPDDLGFFVDDRSPTMGSKVYALAHPSMFNQRPNR